MENNIQCLMLNYLQCKVNASMNFSIIILRSKVALKQTCHLWHVAFKTTPAEFCCDQNEIKDFNF